MGSVQWWVGVPCEHAGAGVQWRVGVPCEHAGAGDQWRAGVPCEHEGAGVVFPERVPFVYPSCDVFNSTVELQEQAFVVTPDREWSSTGPRPSQAPGDPEFRDGTCGRTEVRLVRRRKTQVHSPESLQTQYRLLWG